MAHPVLALIDTSPLRVRRKQGLLTVAEKDSGTVVVDGAYAAAGSADSFVARSASDVWRVQRRGADGARAVLDGSGRQVATLRRERFRATVLSLRSGEQIRVARSKLPFAARCSIGDLANVRAPFAFPQRGYTMTLTADLLARRDRELIVAIGAYVAESLVTGQLAASAD